MSRPLISAALLIALAAPLHAEIREHIPLLGTLEGDGSPITRTLFLPDNKTVLISKDDGTLQLWDSTRNKVLKTMRANDQEILALALSPDGTTAISGGEDKTLRFWDIPSGKALAALTAHRDEIHALALSSDGKILASASMDKEIKLWDTLKRQEITSWKEKSLPLSILFSHEANTLLIGREDGTLVLRNTRTRMRRTLRRKKTGPLLAIAVTPDGKQALTGAQDGGLHVWDLTSQKFRKTWRTHGEAIHALAFTLDGKHALSGGTGFVLEKWDTASGYLKTSWRGHLADIAHIAVSPDGTRAVSGGEDGSVKIWSIADTNRKKARPSISVSQSVKVSLGWMLFSDWRLSGDNTMGCATCHMPGKALSDGQALSRGYNNNLYFRNTPSLINMAKQANLYWDGRFPAADLQSLIRDHIAESHFMHADGRLVIERLRQTPLYVEAFSHAYGSEPSYENMLDALEVFLRTLKSREAPFDRYLKGDKNAISASARRGYKLFEGEAGCVRCHSGYLFSDGKMHARAVPEHPDVLAHPKRRATFRRFFRVFGLEDYRTLTQDVGYYAVTKNKRDRGRFRTPSLREVMRTAPYMHNGVFATLQEAIRFENPALTQKQVQDITAFLKTLTSDIPRVQTPTKPEYAVSSAQAEDVQTFASAPEQKDPPLEFPSLAPLPEVPIPPDNPITPEKVELGRRLFFESRLSGNNNIDCAFCHKTDLGWGDALPISKGYPGTSHWRNSQTLINAAYFNKLHWDGSISSLEEQARAAITSNLAGNGDPTLIEERLATVPDYMERFRTVFGVSRPHFEGVMRALAAFIRAVPLSRDTPLDLYLRGDTSALSPSAQKGMSLFHGKAGCIQCHNGPLLSDQDYHALGVPRPASFTTNPQETITLRYQYMLRGVPERIFRRATDDPGLYLTTYQESDIGKFRTPGLRELTRTAPYMHNGAFKTLTEVIDFYNDGGGSSPNKSQRLRPLDLSTREKKDLLAFLESMSNTQSSPLK